MASRSLWSALTLAGCAADVELDDAAFRAFIGAPIDIPPATPLPATIGQDTIAGVLDAMRDGTHPEYGVPSRESSDVVVLRERDAGGTRTVWPVFVGND